jgi:hypothetical protein
MIVRKCGFVSELPCIRIALSQNYLRGSMVYLPFHIVIFKFHFEFSHSAKPRSANMKTIHLHIHHTNSGVIF